ncbi:MAG: oligosaccharide repeat unit polymerase [Bacteroidaceae bacterium]|nr:oligosaccharide repeat unit polymerase [Bacteroidaceae bacterium]
MAWIIIILFSILAISYLCLKIGDFFSPWIITTMIWLAIVVLFQLSGDLLYPLQDRFYTCVIIWVALMSVTSIITYYAFPAKSGFQQQQGTTPIQQDLNINNFFFTVFFVISMVCTPLYLYNIYKIISMFGSEELFFNLRVLANEGEKSMVQTILTYVGAINQALFVICIWRYPKGNKLILTAVILANLMCSIAIMEKGVLFFMLFVTLFVLYEKRRIKISSIAFWSIVLLLVFYGINVLRTPENAAKEPTFVDFFNVYILSPSVAFERAQEKLTEQFGSRSFAFIYALITRLGLGNFVVEPKLQEFVYVPIPTNVYTIFQPFFQDFGYKGVAFFATVYGTFTGWLYRQCNNGGAISKCVYAYVIEILILQFYQENLILSMSMMIQYCFVFFFVLQTRFGLTLKVDKNGSK